MRKIIHLDMDCFFAAVEMRDDPQLCDIPIAIGGSGNRSVVSTCNYPARAFGVRSAMSRYRALELCPHLRFLPVQMEKYREAADMVFATLREFSDLVEVVSIDEAYVEVTGSNLHGGSATYIAQDMRRKIRERTGLTSSAGVACNKFLAKVASEINKPDGQFVIPPEQSRAFSMDLPLEKIPGVGKSRLGGLHKAGLYKGKDAYKMGETALQTQFGKFGRLLYARSQGLDDRPLVMHRIRKSIGCERTLDTDIFGLGPCRETMQEHLLPQLRERIASKDAFDRISRLGVKIKFADFMLVQREQQGDKLAPEIFDQLLEKALSTRPRQGVRLIGVQVGLGTPKSKQQLGWQL